tara:strand:- start:17 stop:724 length:708 start_codon:yes stop_codon:yes gene_type:complete
MKITKKRLQQLIRESIDDEVGDFGFHEITNSPIYVSKERGFYWTSLKELGDPPIGFEIPTSKMDESNNKVEMLFEEARKKINPDAPSRLACVFVCPDLSYVCNPHDVELDHIYGPVYEVEVTGKIFATDPGQYNTVAVQIDRNHPFRNKFINEALSKYWTGYNMQIAMKNPEALQNNREVEVLVEGTVKIIRKVSDRVPYDYDKLIQQFKEKEELEKERQDYLRKTYIKRQPSQD